MKQLLIGAAKVLPQVLEHSSFQISLAGWPAAAALLAAGATVVAVIALLRERPADKPAE